MSVVVKKENKFPDVRHLHLQRDTSIPSRFIQKQALKTAEKNPPLSLITKKINYVNPTVLFHSSLN